MIDTPSLFDDLPEDKPVEKKKSASPKKEKKENIVVEQTTDDVKESHVFVSPIICEHDEVVDKKVKSATTKSRIEIPSSEETKPEVLPEFFVGVWGQNRAKSIVKRWIEENRFPHAIMLFGPDGIGKQIFAFELAKHLNCLWGPYTACDVCKSCIQMNRLQHPSLFLVFPTKSNVGEMDKRETNDDGEVRVTRRYALETEKEIIQAIETTANDHWAPLTVPDAKDVRVISIRFLKQWVQQTKWVGSNRKIAIIAQAHKMNEETSNALLKLLEEPPENSMFILLCNAPEDVLPTILSRCQSIRLEQLPPALIEEKLLKVPHFKLRREKPLDKEDAKIIAEISEGNWLRAKEACADDALTSATKAMDFLRWALTTKERRLMLEEIEKLIRGRKADNIDKLLTRMLYFVRDAMRVQNHREDGLPEGLLIHQPELVKRLVTFANGTKTRDLSKALEYILEAQESLAKRNPQHLLLVSQLMFKLNRLLTANEQI